MHLTSKPSIHRRALLRRCATSALSLLAIATQASAQLPAPPVTGTGLFQLGGYGALTFTRPEHPEDIERADVSELIAALMGWGQLSPRASYLVELDMAKRTTATWTGREADEWLVPVRAYVELATDNLLRLRAGRFLTPIGAWNERYAEPLTLTPTRPLTTYRPFAKSVTGIMVAGDGVVAARDWGYALFWAPELDLDRHLEGSEETAFVQAAGLRVAAEPRAGFTFGFSAARLRRSRPGEPPTGGEPEGREEDPEGRTLFGVDTRLQAPRLEIVAEGTWLLAGEDAPYEGGVFVSSAARLVGQVWGVARVERYRPIDGLGSWLGYAGLTLRATPRWVVKLGRQFSDRPSARIPEGWFLSLSSLF